MLASLSLLVVGAPTIFSNPTLPYSFISLSTPHPLRVLVWNGSVLDCNQLCPNTPLSLQGHLSSASDKWRWCSPRHRMVEAIWASNCWLHLFYHEIQSFGPCNWASCRRSNWAGTHFSTPSYTFDINRVNLGLVSFVPVIHNLTRPTNTTSSSPNSSHRSIAPPLPTPFPNSDQPSAAAGSSSSNKSFPCDYSDERTAIPLSALPENRNREASFWSSLCRPDTTKHESILIPGSSGKEERWNLANVRWLPCIKLSHHTWPISNTDDWRVAWWVRAWIIVLQARPATRVPPNPYAQARHRENNI